VGTGAAITAFSAAGDQMGVTNPQLSALGSYGGSTPTILPLQGSPALDAGGAGGSPSAATDQRGFPRISDGDGVGGATIDIGAAEVELPTVMVTNNDDSGVGSLRAAIAAVPSGGLIRFAPPTYGSTIVLTSGPLVTGAKTMTIDSSGTQPYIAISALGASRIFEISLSADVTLVNLVLTEGLALTWQGGGGIINYGSLRLTDCILTRCKAPTGGGGGLENWTGADVLIDGNTRFTFNTALRGGAIENRNTLVVDGARFWRNSGGHGGAISNEVTGTAVRLQRCHPDRGGDLQSRRHHAERLCPLGKPRPRRRRRNQLLCVVRWGVGHRRGMHPELQPSFAGRSDAP